MLFSISHYSVSWGQEYTYWIPVHRVELSCLLYLYLPFGLLCKPNLFLTLVQSQPNVCLSIIWQNFPKTCYAWMTTYWHMLSVLVSCSTEQQPHPIMGLMTMMMIYFTIWSHIERIWFWKLYFFLSLFS